MNNQLNFMAILLQIEIEMNGMIAENKQREIEGKSMAYTEQDFLNLIKDYELRKFLPREE